MTDSQFRSVEGTIYLFDKVSEVSKEWKTLVKPFIEDKVISELYKYDLKLDLNSKINFSFFDANFEYFFASDVCDLMEESLRYFNFFYFSYPFCNP